MQASKIKVGNDYAANVGNVGREVGVRVQEMITKRTLGDTTNYLIVAVYDGLNFLRDDKGNLRTFQIEVDAVIDDLAKHQTLMAERKAAEDAHRAKVAEAKAKQLLAVRLLAKAIGGQAVEERYGSKYDRHEAAVMTDSDAIEVNEAGYDALIEFLQKQGVTDDNVVMFKSERRW